MASKQQIQNLMNLISEGKDEIQNLKNKLKDKSALLTLKDNEIRELSQKESIEYEKANKYLDQYMCVANELNQLKSKWYVRFLDLLGRVFKRR